MLNEIVFLILAAIIVVAAIKMLNADHMVHAVVFLGLVLAGVAGIFLSLGAEFLAAIQILVYVGAVVTLILFAVMLTTPAHPTEGFAEDRTPLSVLGIRAPPGMDVEALDEVPEETETIADAEAAAQQPEETEDGAEDEGPEDAEEQPSDEEPAPEDTPDDVEDDGPVDQAEDEVSEEPAEEPEPDGDLGGDEPARDTDEEPDEEET